MLTLNCDQEMIVLEMCDLFLTNFARLHRRSWKEDERRIRKYIVPFLGLIQIKSVRPMHVLNLHTEISLKAPVEANRVIELLRRIYNLAMLWGCYEGKNPCSVISRNRETPRDRWVTPEEMPALAAAIAAEPHLYARAALLLYLLVGIRKSELLQAKWSDICWRREILHIRNGKTGDRVVALSSQALRVLQAIPRVEGNPYVIVGHRLGRPLVNIRPAWTRVRDRAKLQDLVLHDLRRTFASWMLISDVPIDLVREALGHKDIRATMRYARRAKSDIKKAVESHGQKISVVLLPQVS